MKTVNVHEAKTHLSRLLERTHGRFVFEHLPAGDYLLFALTDIDDGHWNDPGFFDALPGTSVELSLAHGDKKVQDLRVGQ
jgi:hypothetical protein